MRITLINQFYPPDLSPTGRLAAAVAAHRAAMGDDVTVIAGQGYADSSLRDAPLPDERVRVRRAWTARLGKRRLWRRCVDYALFIASAAWYVMRLPRQDVVICLTTPPFVEILGVLHKLWHRDTRLISWNMDCYPEVVERAGVIAPGGLISRLLQFSNRTLAGSFDHVICLDDAMRSLLVARHGKGGHSAPISVIPNWEPAARFPSRPRFNGQALSPDGNFVALYMGNLGYGHSVDTILGAAHRWQDAGTTVQVMITGGGVQVGGVRRAIREQGLNNIHLLGYVTEDRLLTLQRTAGCSLVTLKDEMLGVMCPSKLHASLAMGLPVVYVGPRGSNVDQAVEEFECGASLRNGDVEGLVAFVDRLRTQRQLHTAYRERARRAFEIAFCDRQALPKFDQLIDEDVCVGGHHGDTRQAAA